MNTKDNTWHERSPVERSDDEVVTSNSEGLRTEVGKKPPVPLITNRTC